MHNIFGWLEVKDVLATRLTCSLLATVGLDHYGDEIPLVFQRDKFRAVTEIAKHPELAKRMRSLFYSTGLLNDLEFDDWEEQRPPPPSPRDAFAASAFDELMNASHDMRAARRGQVYSETKSKLDTAFAIYGDLCQDQEEMLSKDFDLRCLCKLFNGCRNLREVTLAGNIAPGRSLNAHRTAFDKAMARPAANGPDGCQWRTAGIREVRAVAFAAAITNSRLDSLTLSDVSPDLFRSLREWEETFSSYYEDASEEKHREMTDSNLKALFRPLRRLRLVLQVWPDPNDESIEDMITMVVDDMRETFQTGLLKQVLAGARELRVLKFALPNPDLFELEQEEPFYEFFSLRRVLDDVTFPHLYEISISRVLVEADHFVSLLLRHKATLRRLSLSELQLAEPISWLDVFAKFAGQLPNLRKATLRGMFSDLNHVRRTFDFDDPGTKSFMPARDLVEDFIVKGGERPVNVHQLLEDTSQRKPEGYVPPGSPMENIESDDPVLEYDSDELDEMIWC